MCIFFSPARSMTYRWSSTHCTQRGPNQPRRLIDLRDIPLLIYRTQELTRTMACLPRHLYSCVKTNEHKYNPSIFPGHHR